MDPVYQLSPPAKNQELTLSDILECIFVHDLHNLVPAQPSRIDFFTNSFLDIKINIFLLGFLGDSIDGGMRSSICIPFRDFSTFGGLGRTA
jgi:hypothetical protein